MLYRSGAACESIAAMKRRDFSLVHHEWASLDLDIGTKRSRTLLPPDFNPSIAKRYLSEIGDLHWPPQDPEAPLVRRVIPSSGLLSASGYANSGLSAVVYSLLQDAGLGHLSVRGFRRAAIQRWIRLGNSLEDVRSAAGLLSLQALVRYLEQQSKTQPARTKIILSDRIQQGR